MRDRVAREILELAEGLDAGVAPAHEHERERGPTPCSVLVRCGDVELRKHVVAEVDRLLDGLESDPVLREPRDRQDTRPRPGCQRHDVVADRPLLAGGGPDVRLACPVVDAGHLADHQPAVPQDPSERDDRRAGVDRPRRHLGEEGLVLEEALRVHDGHPVTVGHDPVQPHRRVEAGEPGADDEDVAPRPPAAHAADSRYSSPGSSARVEIDPSASSSCSAVGRSGASPRSIQIARMPTSFAGRTS